MTVVARVAVFAVCAAVFCPSAAAIDPSRLALMPLPKKALGPDAAALTLANGSGVDSNAEAAIHAGRGVTAADLASLGRVTGYTLDYGRTGVSQAHADHLLIELQSVAELYRSESTAIKGLAFWRGVTQALTTSETNGVTVGLASFKASVGDGAFAFELTYFEAGKPLAYVGDVVFRTGDLLGAVFVTATDDRGLRARTVDLADKLAGRMRQVVAGRIPG
jgi:hypothetical protein